jgi:glycosyltransferase involved in cell wall biosynthesis
MQTKLKFLFSKFIGLKKKIGLRHAFKLGLKKYLLPKISPLQKVNLPKEYYYLNLPLFGFKEKSAQAIKNVINQKKINWVVPDFGIGSGGHTTIFRIIFYLEQLGFANNIYITYPCNFPEAKIANHCIQKHFFPLNAKVFIGHEAMQPAWATIATRWETAYIVNAFQGSLRQYYLVQDFEPHFYAAGSKYHLAERTYRFNLYGITAGTWLKSLLHSKYNMDATAFGFGVDHHIFKPLKNNRNETRTPKILFYARPITERRGFELGMLTLMRVAQKLDDVEFILIGGDIDTDYFDHRFKTLGVISPKELAFWYNQCDVALVLSLTNLSLLPLELMACGCAVVSNAGENVTWLLNRNIAFIVDPDIEKLSDALIKMLKDNCLRKKIMDAGMNFAKSKKWELEFKPVANLLLKHHQQNKQVELG